MEIITNNSKQTTRSTTPEKESLNTCSSNKKGFTPFVTGVIILIIIIAGAFSYLGFQRNGEVSKINQQMVNFNNNLKSGNPNKPQVSIKQNIQSFIYYTVSPYAKYWGGEYKTHIYLYNPNVKQEKEIFTIPTTEKVQLSRIVISPDGKKIAYSLYEATVPGTLSPYKNRQLWIVNTDGSENQLMYADDTNGSIFDYLTWSPDSKYLIFYNNSQVSYKLSVADKKVEKVNFPGIIAGWFTDGKLGFNKADTSYCSGDCYNPDRAILTNVDGSDPVEVYTPNNSDFIAPGFAHYSWLPNGTGFVRTKNNSIVLYDFSQRKDIDLIKLTTQNGRLGGITFFPKSNKAMMVVLDGNTTIYKIDFSNNFLTKFESYDWEASGVIKVSADEKYLVQQYDESVKLYTIDGKLLGQTGDKKDLNLLGFSK